MKKGERRGWGRKAGYLSNPLRRVMMHRKKKIILEVEMNGCGEPF